MKRIAHLLLTVSTLITLVAIPGFIMLWSNYSGPFTSRPVDDTSSIYTMYWGTVIAFWLAAAIVSGFSSDRSVKNGQKPVDDWDLMTFRDKKRK